MASIKRVLIANRGEIAVRITRTLRELGVEAVAVATPEDRASLHALRADRVLALVSPLGYLDAEALVSLATRAGCDAVHPGYGFLSENAEFAEACERAGLIFIGPPAQAIAKMGSKVRARAAMRAAGVPIVPGGDANDLEQARATASAIGYPILIKATDGGGGKGMRRVDSEAELAAAFERTTSEAQKAFGNGALYIERALGDARHVELQILGDRAGRIVHLFERDCSLQRRHQKIIEETPCPVLPAETLEQMADVARRGAESIGYFSVGTFEFLLASDGSFYFLEMNTRLQVEHPITELCTGLDLVREMLRVAEGKPLDFEAVTRRGAAIEARLYAEDPDHGFLPSAGQISGLRAASGPFVRDDSGVYEGARVSDRYDPMLAKLSVWAPDRAQAIARMRRALGE
ncbi:MAG TPA: biotin carboxylase N-terminal domain-containing protein, partial [Polyangiaceae bacterium]